jgi:hypothetical protein
MKTSDVSSNKPVQGNTGQGQRTEQKKPDKQFDKVLDESSSKQQASAKKAKPFSPLETKGHKKVSIASDKKEAAAAKAEGKAEKEKTGMEETRDYDRIEAKGERDMGGGHGMKKEASEELVAQQMQVNPSVQGSQGIQQAGAAEAVQRPGLNINEIQSIVNRVDLAVNEKGLPEMRFELQTQNLGNIDLKVSAENDQIRIEFATDDINAQKVLEENLNELGEKLREKGLNLAETRFSQRGQEDAEKQQQNQQQQEDQDYFPSSTTGRKRTFNL